MTLLCGGMEVFMTIGNKIRILRQGRNMTRSELAEKSGLTEITIKQYEIGEFPPDPKQIDKLVAALNVLPSDINTKNYWRSPDNHITVKIPNFLEKDFSDAVHNSAQNY